MHNSEPVTSELAHEEGATRGAILDAAAVAFMTKGYAATSIDDVAELLHATKGKIYHHYRKKAYLFYDVHKRALDIDLAAVQRAADMVYDTSIERLYAMTIAHIFVIMNHLPYQRVAVQGLDMHFAGATTAKQRDILTNIIVLRDKYEALFSDMIARVICEGSVPAQDVSMVVKAYFGAMNWTTIWFRERPGQTHKEKLQIANSIATFVIRGLGTNGVTT